MTPSETDPPEDETPQESTGLAGLRSWRAVYWLVFAVFWIYVLSLWVFSRYFS